mgnify:CR=1 FL=1
MINSFTKTHVKFFEHTAIKQAIEINRWKLDNSSASNLPHVTESMEADLLGCFETTKYCFLHWDFLYLNRYHESRLLQKMRGFLS